MNFPRKANVPGRARVAEARIVSRPTPREASDAALLGGIDLAGAFGTGGLAHRPGLLATHGEAPEPAAATIRDPG